MLFWSTTSAALTEGEEEEEDDEVKGDGLGICGLKMSRLAAADWKYVKCIYLHRQQTVTTLYSLVC